MDNNQEVSLKRLYIEPDHSPDKLRSGLEMARDSEWLLTTR